MANNTVRVENWPQPDGLGTPERVAWDMVLFLRCALPDGLVGRELIEKYLDLYAECLSATKGDRIPQRYDGM